MDGRLAFPIIGLVAGVAVASLVPGLSQSVRKAIGLGLGGAQLPADGASNPELRKPEADRADKKPAVVRSNTGSDHRRPHRNGDRLKVGRSRAASPCRARSSPMLTRSRAYRVKLSGTVAELRKKLGDPVAKDEVVAVLESREVADAKSEYLAARLTNELQQDLFERDKLCGTKGSQTSSNFCDRAIWPHRRECGSTSRARSCLRSASTRKKSPPCRTSRKPRCGARKFDRRSRAV